MAKRPSHRLDYIETVAAGKLDDLSRACSRWWWDWRQSCRHIERWLRWDWEMTSSTCDTLDTGMDRDWEREKCMSGTKCSNKTLPTSNSQDSLTRACKVATTNATARIARTPISWTRLLLCIAKESLTCIAHLHRYRIPAIIAKHTASECGTVWHANETWRLSCATRIHVGRCDLKGWCFWVDIATPEGCVVGRRNCHCARRLTFYLRIIATICCFNDQTSSNFPQFVFTFTLTSRNTVITRMNDINFSRSIPVRKLLTNWQGAVTSVVYLYFSPSSEMWIAQRCCQSSKSSLKND